MNKMLLNTFLAGMLIAPAAFSMDKVGKTPSFGQVSTSPQPGSPRPRPPARPPVNDPIGLHDGIMPNQGPATSVNLCSFLESSFGRTQETDPQKSIVAVAQKDGSRLSEIVVFIQNTQGLSEQIFYSKKSKKFYAVSGQQNVRAAELATPGTASNGRKNVYDVDDGKKIMIADFDKALNVISVVEPGERIHQDGVLGCKLGYRLDYSVMITK